MSQAHKNRIKASNFSREKSKWNNFFKDFESEKQMAKKEKLAIREKHGSSGSTPLDVYPPTQGGIRFYKFGQDLSHAARLRGNKERGTDSSAKRVPVK